MNDPRALADMLLQQAERSKQLRALRHMDRLFHEGQLYVPTVQLQTSSRDQTWWRGGLAVGKALERLGLAIGSCSGQRYTLTELGRQVAELVRESPEQRLERMLVRRAGRGKRS